MKFNNVITMLVAGCILAGCGSSDSSNDDQAIVIPVNDTEDGSDYLYDYTIVEGINYGTANTQSSGSGTKDLLLDLYSPIQKENSNDSFPILMIIHGGAFQAGSRTQDILQDYAKSFVEKGYVVASIDYRLIPDQPILSTPGENLFDRLINIDGVSEELAEDLNRTKASEINHLNLQFESAIAAIEDSVTAIHWLKDNSDSLNIDWDRFALLGGSAGAITAIHLTYYVDDVPELLEDPKYQNLPKVKAVVNHWGGLLASPSDLSSVESGEAAMFTIHGTHDQTVPYFFAERLKERTSEVSVPHELHSLQNFAHGFSNIDVKSIETAPGSGVTLYERAIQFVEIGINEAECLAQELTIDNC